MPPMPALDPALNTEVGYGRLAAIVRERTMVALRILFSLTAGDIIATDGPVTAEETVEGGAMVTFPDLTLRAGSGSGAPYLVVIGDLEVGASDVAGGGVEYRARIDGPIDIFAGGEEIATLSFDTLILEGESHPDSILLGKDTFTLKDMVLTVLDNVRDPLEVTIGTGLLMADNTDAGDGTLGGEATFDFQTVGISRGEREPTIAMATFEGRTTYDGVPGAWLEVYEVMAGGERLPRQDEVISTVAALMGTNALGTSDGSMEMTGIEVYLSPTEAISFDRIGMEMMASEPVSGAPAGRMAMQMDGLRTKGPSLPVQVDLGALRMSIEGQGFDAARLRGFLASYMNAVAPILDLEPAEMEARAPELLEGMAGDTAALMRDVALGEGKSVLSLSGLDIREQGRTTFGIGTLDITGGWAEDDRGRLSGPATMLITDLAVNDPQAGMPVSVGRIAMDSQTDEFDLRAFREIAARAIEATSEAAANGAGDPMVMLDDLAESLNAINQNAAVAGGRVSIAVEAVELGTEMSPMGGLEGFTFDFDITPAEPGVEVADANLAMSMKGLDPGPMAAAAAPPALIPTGAALALKGTSLPVPALSRLGMSDPMGTGATDANMEAELARLLETHVPTFDLSALTVDADAFDVDGSGQVTVAGMMPQQVQGTISLALRGLDETMTLLQERVQSDPSLQEPLLVLVALRGLGRPGAPGTHVYDIELSPEAGVLINGTPAAAMMMAPPPGQAPGQAPGQTPGQPDDGGMPAPAEPDGAPRKQN
jgi:hypothetical protein